ncbi:peroxisomal membrane anchor protein, putative [Talaromyces stipitatus ATCC 10500]|uniref:Peroxisomal membrane protein PEX14 n=1 Tax=Talaromyces stipitatus (strain ATCC 10500 / CBS 375.48 / QM 6759 / NRRL 1006) TaxID=441959 RepID=B8LZK0_TALSN|nr:peroxisomal membrane anchor protein, putative [Talaromyces stipitatus ATCC 10500]EED22423.1 peroxisomal membrane anchor protein, putative [Talaromyces stipitatus ATCC 10500]
MSDNSSKSAIPEWQRKATSTSSPADQTNDSADKPVETSSTEEEQVTTPSDRSALLEQAKTFLADPEIRDATTKSKGLTNDEINSLLGVSRNEGAPTTPETETTTTNNQARVESDTASATAVASKPPSNSMPSPRDIPPIITYPEFLVNASAQSKPPLLSLRSVLDTLYGAAGLGATFYGASEFLVKPMLRSLGDARHELAETALTNLSTLNEKLEKNVSKIPVRSLSSEKFDADEDDETESITSDPTEVFHRDIATQTTPDLLNDSITTTPSTDAEANPHKAIDSHKQTLAKITSHLQEFVSDHTTSGEIDDTMRNRVADLQSYLDGLKYSSYNTYINSNNLYNTSYNYPMGDTTNKSKEEDAIAAFRAEIRGVKGALLSARNFPSGRPAGIAR